MAEIIHKWDHLFKPPYRFVRIVSVPSPSLAEANPAAYNAALREMSAMSEGWSLCTCEVCGQTLMHNALCVAADGTKFTVGCDCVMKLGSSKFVSEVEAAERKRKRALSRERRAAKRKLEQERQRAAYEAHLEKQRQTNGGLTDEEFYQKRRKDAISQALELLTPLADRLEDGRGGFCDSVASDLRNGRVPTGRGFAITQDILAKQMGRRNSKAYEDEETRVGDLLRQAEEIVNSVQRTYTGEFNNG